jgi:hypothetical protein
MRSYGITAWRSGKWTLSGTTELKKRVVLKRSARPTRGFSKNSCENIWKNLLLGVLGFAAVSAFVVKNFRLVEPVRMLGDRIQTLNIFYFIQTSTFFHRLPLII